MVYCCLAGGDNDKSESRSPEYSGNKVFVGHVGSRGLQTRINNSIFALRDTRVSEVIH